MKIAVSIYRDEQETPLRSLSVKPETKQELDEACTDVTGFLSECFDELEQEGY